MTIDYLNVETKYIANTEEELRNIIESLVDKDVVFTYHSGLVSENDKLSGFIFHTVDPNPLITATEIIPHSTPRMIANSLNTRLSSLDVEDEARVGFYKAWVIDLIQVDPYISIAICAQYVPQTISVAKH